MDATNLNHALVKEGWCWWYRKYAPGDSVLEGLEKEAREAKKGLRADPQLVRPWDWRRLIYIERFVRFLEFPFHTRIHRAGTEITQPHRLSLDAPTRAA